MVIVIILTLIIIIVTIIVMFILWSLKKKQRKAHNMIKYVDLSKCKQCIGQSSLYILHSLFITNLVT